MGVIRRINDELAIAGYLTLEQLQEVIQEGFKSVLDLRSLNQTCPSNNEQQQVEALGLYYLRIPTQIEAINPETAALILQYIAQIHKPALVHCNNAMLAAAMVLMYIATQQGSTIQQAFKRAEQLGLFRTFANESYYEIE